MDDQQTAAERRALDSWTAMEPPTDFADRVLDRELDATRTERRGDRPEGRRLAVAAIVGACVAAAAVVALVVTRRGPTEERSTLVVEPAARPPDPAPAPVTRTGIRVESALPFEIRAPYGTTWVANDPGAREVAAGSGLRFRGAPAQITAWDTTFEIRSAAVVEIDSPSNFELEAGSITVRARALVSARVRGGTIMLDGPSEAELNSDNGDTMLATVSGSVRVLGKTPSDEHLLAVGERVRLDARGAIALLEASPTDVDVKVRPEATITIHDPSPPTAIQFVLPLNCPGSGIVELAKDGQYGDPQRGGGFATANLLVEEGSWTYRVRCIRNGFANPPVAAGRVHVLRDSGNRSLPPNQPAVNRIDADGRNYRITYDSVPPTVEFHAKGQGARFTLHLARDGSEELFDSRLPTVLVPGTKLRDGHYMYWFDADGTKDAKVSTLTIDVDDTAPQLRIDSPVNGFPTPLHPKSGLAIRGFAAPGWAVSVDSIQLPVDLRGRFAANLNSFSNHALAVRAEHASRGTHYYLRRPR